jgi:hypothetical protein
VSGIERECTFVCKTAIFSERMAAKRAEQAPATTAIFLASMAR